MGGIEDQGKRTKDVGNASEPEIRPEDMRAAARSADQGVVDNITTLVHAKMAEDKLPTKEGLGYESTLGIYGGKLARDPADRLVYDTRGQWSQIDRWGDRFLRSFDEHHVRKPLAMLRRHPKAFLKFLPFIVDSKRYRGTPEQTMENARRLGVDDMYGEHPWGIEIRQPDVFSKCIALQDIFWQDKINHPAIKDIDRFDALGKAAQYLSSLHKTAGGIGEANVYAFLFKQARDNKVEDPTLMISSVTEIYNPEKHVSLIDQKATELLDLCISTVMQEYRRSQSWESVNQALGVVLKNYNEKDVIDMTASFVKRGRGTMPGDLKALEFETSPTYRGARGLMGQHNRARLMTDPDITAEARRRILEACEKFSSDKSK